VGVAGGAIDIECNAVGSVPAAASYEGFAFALIDGHYTATEFFHLRCALAEMARPAPQGNAQRIPSLNVHNSSMVQDYRTRIDRREGRGFSAHRVNEEVARVR